MTPSPTPTSTPVSIKKPRGVYVYGTDAINLPSNNGARLMLNWKDCEITPGAYNFAATDGKVAKTVAAHKQVSLTLYILEAFPDYMRTTPGVTIYTTANGEMVVPMDTAVDLRIRAFIKAVCAHYDGVVDYLVMGGLGFHTETHMPLPGELTPQPTSSDAEWMAKWEVECDILIDTYGANLTKTPFIIAGGNPFKGNTVDGQASFMRVFNYGLIYAGFLPMQWGLNASSNSGYFVNALVQQYGGGFQATGTCTIPVGGTGHVGGDCQGTLGEMLDAADALDARWVELYPADALDTASQATIDAANKKLIAIP